MNFNIMGLKKVKNATVDWFETFKFVIVILEFCETRTNMNVLRLAQCNSLIIPALLALDTDDDVLEDTDDNTEEIDAL